MFGYSVSLSGNIAIVGAYSDVNGVDSGSAYVFERDDSTSRWNETAKLTASDGVIEDLFGYSVSVSGNTAVIGAYLDNDKGISSGSAYMFLKDDSTGNWNETAKFTASDGVAGDNFGWSVSIYENTAIIGARATFTGFGSAYIFEKDELTGFWNETAILTASDGFTSDLFGHSVSVSGNIAIVGAYLSDSAYVFEKDVATGDWNEMAKLTASDGVGGDNFGWSLSISGNIAIVGSYLHDGDKGTNSGSAYVFERDDLTGIWNETAKLTASDGSLGDLFGSSVSVSGNIAVVGAIFDDDNDEDSGSAYVFERDESTGNWKETSKLIASDGAITDFFGRSVSVSGNAAIVGAHQDDDNGIDSGSVYAFERLQK